MAQQLTPARMEAFSDGVIAVIITIMVLDLKVPTHQAVPNDLEALRNNAELIVLYLLSFVQVGIYWVNHHYLLDDVEVVTHASIWLNLIFLFFLSLFPFATSWLGTRGINSFSVATYSIISFLPALGWIPLARRLRRPDEAPINDPRKEYLSLTLYLTAIIVSFFAPRIALTILCIVAVFWLLPPTRVIQQHTRNHGNAPS